MKALEILNNDNIFDENYVAENNYKKLINEAIKELEELNNRSCYDCKHWCQEFQSIGICDKGIKEEKQFRESLTYSMFYCNKWEQKC